METVKFVHKCVNKSLPDYFHSFFSHVSKSHDHCTRSTKHNDLVIPYYRTKRAQKSVKYRGSKLWNSIPDKIKKLNLNQDRPLAQLLSARYRCKRSGVRIPGQSNLHSVANDSPPLRRFFGAVLPRR